MTENAPDTFTSLETKVEATLGQLESAPNEDVKKEWGKNYKSLVSRATTHCFVAHCFNDSVIGFRWRISRK